MQSKTPGDSVADSLHKLVHTMDRTADKILQKQFGITYKRAYFLLTLQHLGAVSQHRLATALGYSDASVSTMLSELVKAGYVIIEPSPTHGRKKLVSLTPLGDNLVTEGRSLLGAHFNNILKDQHISIHEYQAQTEKLYLAVTAELN
jgi:DNA-binding MarR family transcriptional regulator